MVVAAVVGVGVGSSAFCSELSMSSLGVTLGNLAAKYNPKAMMVSKFGVIGSKNHRQYCHMLTFPNGSDGFLEKRRHE